MHKHVWLVAMVTLCLGLSSVGSGWATTKTLKEKNAIIIANFGTTVPEGLTAIGNIVEAVRTAYPQTEVRLTFTSNIIRSVWRKRQEESQKWLDQGVPEEVLYVKNFIATVGDLLEDGYRDIVVQPTHMFYMEQSYDVHQYIDGLASIRTMKSRWKPVDRIVMGRPALGMPGDQYPYHQDVEAVCRSLAPDVEAARKAGSALVYMGHGNDNWPSGIYLETQKAMQRMYPEVQTFIGVVEGSPSLDDLRVSLKAAGVEKIHLKPLMIVAGDHATNDMAGPEDDSWRSILTKDGYTVTPIMEGLGRNAAFVQIFVDHIADAARDARIELR
ncbi:MAG: sirohydrochlorin cobaltochelatase [Desulfopila sp.]